ncbi:MAG: hypothetical protein HY042_09400, partial [Spirochaetia bacterium]|nr:hypothetical protein [Spirochaetia bacterium]
ELLRDPGGKMTIEEALKAREQGRFERSAQDIPSLGFVDGVVWLTVSITNDTEFNDWYLSIRYPAHDHIWFYETDNGMALRTEVSGDSLPFASREIRIRDFAFALHIPPGETRTYFVALKSWNSMVLPVYVNQLMPLMEEAGAETLVYGVYLGLIVVIILYNVFLYISVRDRSYLYYVLYLLAFGLFQASFLGVALQYFLPEHPLLVDRLNPILGAFSFILAGLFAFHFLQLGRLSRVFAWAFRILLGATIVAIPAIGIFGNRIINLYGVAWPILLMAAGVWMLGRGFRPARFFVLAWSGFTLIVVLWTLAVRGLIMNEILFRYGLLAGSSLEVVLLSLALGDRINILEMDRQKALEEQLHTKTRLLESFYRFVPVQFIRFLGLESVETVHLGAGVRRDVTVLFSDMRDFTALSESMSADENFRFINAYLKRVAPVIDRHGGFIDKFIGDAVMAIFPESPDDALRASLEMMKELSAYNEQRTEKGLTAIRIGIGIHSGPVVLGTVGTEGRMDTTIIGDTVNTASRIEGQTKVLGAPILLSEATLS